MCFGSYQGFMKVITFTPLDSNVWMLSVVTNFSRFFNLIIPVSICEHAAVFEYLLQRVVHRFEHRHRLGLD